MPPLSSLCCDSNVKHYLIFSDETGKKLSALTCATETKLKRQRDSARNMLKVSMLLLEYGKIAYFQIQPHQAVFFPGCLWRSLHIHGPPVLRTCH